MNFKKVETFKERSSGIVVIRPVGIFYGCSFFVSIRPLRMLVPPVASFDLGEMIREQLDRSGHTGREFSEFGAYLEESSDEETRHVLGLMQKKFKTSTGQIAKKFSRGAVDINAAGDCWQVWSSTYMPIERVDQGHLFGTVRFEEGSERLGELVISSLEA